MKQRMDLERIGYIIDVCRFCCVMLFIVSNFMSKINYSFAQCAAYLVHRIYGVVWLGGAVVRALDLRLLHAVFLKMYENVHDVLV